MVLPILSRKKGETTANGRNRLSGICVTCNTKKGMFVNSKWKIHEKTPDEQEKAAGKNHILKMNYKFLR